MPKLSIIDYDVGNIFSVEQACRKVGFDCAVSADPQGIASADAIILPGVGAFGDAMRKLHERGLAEAVARHVAAGRPLLGICLGMQLLMSGSEEFGAHEGLDLVPGQVRRFADAPGVKIPQVQWNELRFAPGSALFAGLDSGVPMYFLHSYYVAPAASDYFQATAEYAGLDYCCALERENVFAVQFHPERSGEQGLEIFRNFKNLI
jgi:imidazole glycerol-phosphate synthase subunit HisH